ncbi:FUSC family protein [Romboutsia ilealis]|uniref:FUSC family protein n=1 Tax=Romboutsia ilealis TaxID=1115758 RepID=UPI00272AD2F0|nr:aromatic acid exporter family protein [Romboutsia ilealis]
MKLHKPGMRNIKTGIGVMICVLVGYLNIIDNTLFAAVACIVCMQTTVKGSLTVGLNRLKGTFIGGLIGFIFVLIHPGSPILSCLCIKDK